VEQLTQSSGLSHAVGNDTIFDLSAGAGDDGLPLGRPENQIVPRNTAYPDIEHRVSGQLVQSASV
jgi:hypothetical protein